jgi:hypothetical protein
VCLRAFGLLRAFGILWVFVFGGFWVGLLGFPVGELLSLFSFSS